ncbi:hypothetical protein [Emticicia sp. C21]|uniref:hypothetical protein n=1 Tax=Emticicia sp. C21 TaxID=2302915 RepID=UPI000E34F856|nr:hypothetical protein [Emticicia sp. C21]RFS17614.1 hypothetical protein D0T08_07545 [Emticicia sp. C21]
MKKSKIILSLVIIIFSSCASNGYTAHQHGFFYGVIHGLVFPFALISKLFTNEYGLYAENNTGFFYWLGFIIGIFGLGGGGRAASRR